MHNRDIEGEGDTRTSLPNAPVPGPKFEPVTTTCEPPTVGYLRRDTAEIDGGVYDTVVDGSDVVLLD